MLDIKFVRENPEKVKENIRKKFQDQKLVLVDEVIDIDKKIRGVVVLNISQSSKAYQSGLRAGDVIKAINGRTISNISDYNNFVKSYGNEKSYTITIKRARMTYVIIVE